MKRGMLRNHWETVVLLAVAVLCGASISVLNGQQGASALSSAAIAGLRAADVEKAVLAVDPGARSSPFISSGRRSITYTIDRPAGTDGSITVDSQLADGTVDRVECEANSTPAIALTAAANPVLKFCATLPATGAADDTVGWIDQQFAPAAVGYSQSLQHNNLQYELRYSQYDTDRTHYDITVEPG